MPTCNAATDGTFTEPLKFKVVLKGNKSYRGETASRVSELNDHFFEDARHHHGVLVERIHAASSAPVTPQQLASAILQALQSGRVVLADVESEDIRKLAADVPRKRIARPKPGDVLAIPARNGGYHMAVVVTLNRFGTALGLFHGTSVQGGLDADLCRAPRKYPAYTGNNLVLDVDHHGSLLALLPSDPPIHHRHDAWQSYATADTGAFGAAETADGTLRLIGSDEAREVGLLNGTYQQVHLAAYLQKQLDVEADRS